MPSAAHATTPAGRRPHGLRSADTIKAASPHVMARAYSNPKPAVRCEKGSTFSTNPYGPNVNTACGPHCRCWVKPRESAASHELTPALTRGHADVFQLNRVASALTRPTAGQPASPNARSRSPLRWRPLECRPLEFRRSRAARSSGARGNSPGPESARPRPGPEPLS